MSALRPFVSALSREKPRSSITELVDLLTSAAYKEEQYDGLPELATSISLQPTGPAEASRALRKKIKHGNTHQKSRAIVILKALVENGAPAFQSRCMDDAMVDALKQLASDTHTDQRVKQRLANVLSGWSVQFRDDPALQGLAGLYKQCFSGLANRRMHDDAPSRSAAASAAHAEQKRKSEERDAAKRKAKQEREKHRAEEEQRKRKYLSRARHPFDFEKEKPQILTAIAGASQATHNLLNAMKLVNVEKGSIATDANVQDCLTKAKAARRAIIRYTQLVENEEMVGTLLATNDQIMDAVQRYDALVTGAPESDPTAEIQSRVAAVTLGSTELSKQDDRTAAGHAKQQPNGDDSFRHGQSSGSPGGYVHPDLQDLSFGSLGSEQDSLPPPMRPSTRHSSPEDADWSDGRGLSDFSDYESVEDEGGEHSHSIRDEGPSPGTHRQARKTVEAEDPFADPFAD